MNGMEAWRLFPYPTSNLNFGCRLDGCIVAQPSVCLRCVERPCERDGGPIGDIKTCKFGMNYAYLMPDTLIQGVVVSDATLSTKIGRRRSRSLPEARVRTRDVKKVIAAVAELDADAADDFRRARDAAIQASLGEPEVRAAIVDDLKGTLTNSLNQSHDFLQLLRQVRGQIVAILEERFPGVPPEIAAEKLESEGAIFFSTELMLAKLDATLFLTEPNRAFADERPFILHGLVTKYFRIYRAQANQKGVNIRTVGESYGHVRQNNPAVGAVVHALLDNCVKYAPNGSKADIKFSESTDKISVEFISLGPRIRADERALIFTPGFRAKAALEIETTGLGFGLAAAKKVSDMLDLDLQVRQESVESEQFPAHYLTIFSIEFNRTDRVGD